MVSFNVFRLLDLLLFYPLYIHHFIVAFDVSTQVILAVSRSNKNQIG